MNVTFELGNISEWLTAIGTIGAVIVSLYFSYNRTSKKAKVICLFHKKPLSSYYESRIVNQGLIPIVVSTHGIIKHKPFWKRREKEMVVSSKSKPRRLIQSETCKTYYEAYEINKRLIELGHEKGDNVKLICSYRDTIGDYYYTTFNFIVSEYKPTELIKFKSVEKLSEHS